MIKLLYLYFSRVLLKIIREINKQILCIIIFLLLKPYLYNNFYLLKKSLFIKCKKTSCVKFDIF